MEWAAAKERQEEAAKAVVTNDVKTPDIPPHVEKCVRYGLALSKKQTAQNAKKGKDKQERPPAAQPSADELVLAEVQTAEERQKCARAVLTWYKQIQEANRKAAAAKQTK